MVFSALDSPVSETEIENDCLDLGQVKMLHLHTDVIVLSTPSSTKSIKSARKNEEL